MSTIKEAAEEIRQLIDDRQAKRDAEKAFNEKVERVAMHILGKSVDPAPGINWFCNRAWGVNEVRSLVRSALEAEEVRA